MTILPTLRQLQFFVALARRGSFSKAAEDCYVSQSTLSSAIKELEGIVGAQLVDRSTRSLSLTPNGESVASQATSILASTEDLVLSVSNRPLLSGAFRLGIIPTIAPFIFPTLSPLLQKAHPKLQLFLREDISASLLEQLTGGQIDAALLALPYDMQGMETIELGEDIFWFACAPTHPFADKDTIDLVSLKDTPLLLLEDGHCLRDHALDACQLRSARQSEQYGGTSLLTLAEMTRAGLGATLLPDMAVRTGMAKLAGLMVKPLVKPFPARKIGLAWRNGAGRSDEVQALSNVVKEGLEKVQALL